MRLACTAWSQFAEIEVVFNQWKHPGELQPLLAICEAVGLHACGTEQNGYPLVLGKGATALLYFVHIDVRHLNRGQLHDADWRGLLVFLDVLIFKPDNTPDTTA